MIITLFPGLISQLLNMFLFITSTILILQSASSFLIFLVVIQTQISRMFIDEEINLSMVIRFPCQSQVCDLAGKASVCDADILYATSALFIQLPVNGLEK